MIILAGDIGGTNTRLALYDAAGLEAAPARHYENATARGLAELVEAYLGAAGARPEAACFAVAGPTDGRQARLTNLPWAIDAADLATRFRLPCRLINDFAAVGWGLEALTASGLRTLQAGVARPGAPRLALGAGTGLGVAQCFADPAGYRVEASEGGHIGFAPIDEEQWALARALQAAYAGRVSVERILSGPGIAALYDYCRRAMGRPTRRERDPAEVTAAALAGDDATALWAMCLFCAIYGQTAGDLALVTRAEGGVYLAGGIAAKILPLLEDGRFIAGFRAKGRFSEWMASLPVHVVLDPDVGLKGAARAARRG
jgi:glucokinase